MPINYHGNSVNLFMPQFDIQHLEYKTSEILYADNAKGMATFVIICLVWVSVFVRCMREKQKLHLTMSVSFSVIWLNTHVHIMFMLM